MRSTCCHLTDAAHAATPRRYQTDSDVVLSIFIRNVDPAALKVEFEDRSVRSSNARIRRSRAHPARAQFTISFPLPTGSEFSWGVDPLSHAISPAQSTFRVLAPKIELTLKKKDAAVRWGKLEGEDVGPVDTMARECSFFTTCAWSGSVRAAPGATGSPGS